MTPTSITQHELLHLIGCEHGLSMASCYEQIAKLKKARVGEFFPAWDAENKRILATRHEVFRRLYPRAYPRGTAR